LSIVAAKQEEVTLTEAEKKLSDGRADFMKRFFSVAVSVGFASKNRRIPISVCVNNRGDD
jgi:hypothetical protein